MNGVTLQAESHRLSLNTSIYSIEAIKKTAYKFADRASVIISPGSESGVTVTFNFVGKHSQSVPEHVIADFCNELLDQELREIIKREAGPVRNLILAHAFSKTSLSEKS